MRKLTTKQEKFCLLYYEKSNATEAAIAAGYSPKTAAVIASENLIKPKISDRIAAIRQKAVDASIASVQERQQILTEIARARQTDFMTCSADGVWMHDIGPESINKAAIKQVQTTTMPYGDKEQDLKVILTKVELHDSIKAINELNKMDGAHAPTRLTGGDGEPLTPPSVVFVFSSGDVIKPPRTELIEGVTGDDSDNGHHH